MDIFAFRDTYPDHPGFKRRDTAVAAAEAIAGRAPLLRHRVEAAIRNSRDGLTADEAAAAIGQPILSVRPRLSELANIGAIRDSGERRTNSSGRKAAVWVVA